MEKIVIMFVLAICGASALYFESENRMTGGNNAVLGQFPYAVSLQQLSQQNTIMRGHRCGGVLISLQHVLTSATCLYNRNASTGVVTLITASEYRVFGGSIILTNDTSPDLYRIPQNITVHPEYTGYPAFLNDIAVIALNNPFPSNIGLTPITLPAANFEPGYDTLCTVAGWGSQNVSDNASVNLRYARKYIYNQQLCTLLYNVQSGVANILPSMVCAASYDIISAGCNGDHGNALVCQGGLTGILSITNNCQATSYPEVYTRVSNYTAWIRSVTGGASTFQPGVAVLFMFAVVQLITIKVIS